MNRRHFLAVAAASVASLALPKFVPAKAKRLGPQCVNKMRFDPRGFRIMLVKLTRATGGGRYDCEMLMASHCDIEEKRAIAVDYGGGAPAPVGCWVDARQVGETLEPRPRPIFAFRHYPDIDYAAIDLR